MALALPLLLVSALGAGGSLDVGIGGEGIGRTTDSRQVTGDRRTVDLSAEPRLGLRVLGEPASAALGYHPRFTLRDVGPHQSREVLHQGELRLGLEPGPAFRLETYGSGEVGRTDLVTLGATAPAGQTRSITTTSTLNLRALRAGLSLRAVPERRSELTALAEASVSGGTDRASRASLPTERALRGELQYLWAATRLDRLGLRAAAQGSRMPDRDEESAWASLLGVWRHRAGPGLLLGAGAGAVALHDSSPAAGAGARGHDTHRSLHPAAELGLERRVEAPADAQGTPRAPTAISGSLWMHLGATTDRATATAAQSADVQSALEVPFAERFRAHASANGAVTWGRAGRIRTGRAEAGCAVLVTPRVRLDLTGYGSWQVSNVSSAPSFSEYGAMLGLTLEAPPLRF